jgi:hypothetical protein
MTVGAIAAGVAVAAVGVGTSLAAKSSANGAAADAQQQQLEGFKNNFNNLEFAKNQANWALDPYAYTGGSANNQLAWEMGLPTTSKGSGPSGVLAKNFSLEDYKKDPMYTPMVTSLADLQATPGYQFQLQQGLQSVNNSAAAKGSLLSGGNIKAINDYAQGQASTGYQAAWQRAMSAYQQAFQNDTTNKNNTFGRLSSMANMGLSATSQQSQNMMKTSLAQAGLSQDMIDNNAALQVYQGQNAANMWNSIGSSINSGIGTAAAYWPTSSPSPTPSPSGGGGYSPSGLSGGSTAKWATQGQMFPNSI